MERMKKMTRPLEAGVLVQMKSIILIKFEMGTKFGKRCINAGNIGSK